MFHFIAFLMFLVALCFGMIAETTVDVKPGKHRLNFWSQAMSALFALGAVVVFIVFGIGAV